MYLYLMDCKLKKRTLYNVNNNERYEVLRRSTENTIFLFTQRFKLKTNVYINRNKEYLLSQIWSIIGNLLYYETSGIQNATHHLLQTGFYSCIVCEFQTRHICCKKETMCLQYIITNLFVIQTFQFQFYHSKYSTQRGNNTSNNCRKHLVSQGLMTLSTL